MSPEFVPEPYAITQSCGNPRASKFTLYTSVNEVPFRLILLKAVGVGISFIILKFKDILNYKDIYYKLIYLLLRK